MLILVETTDKVALNTMLSAFYANPTPNPNFSIFGHFSKKGFKVSGTVDLVFFVILVEKLMISESFNPNAPAIR